MNYTLRPLVTKECGMYGSLPTSQGTSQKNAPLVESRLGARMVPLFIHLTHIVIADAFGDERGLARLRRKLMGKLAASV